MDTATPTTPDRWSLTSWFTAFGAEEYTAFKAALAADLTALLEFAFVGRRWDRVVGACGGGLAQRAPTRCRAS